MKLIVSPVQDDLDSYLTHGAEGFLLPLKSFSTGFQRSYSIEEIGTIREKYPTLPLFILFNQMLLNADLEQVKEILKQLELLQISSIFFYDFGLVHLHTSLGLKTPLVWNQTYMVTNKETADFLFDKGISYGVLSNEITIDEIQEIVKSKMHFFIYLVGYMSAGVSRRKLVTHFYQSLGKTGKSNLKIEEETTKIPFLVQEGEKDTNFLYGKCLNVAHFYETLSSFPIEYGILKEDFLDHDTFLQVLSLYAKREKNLAKETGDLIGRNTGFLARKTVFKVKK